MRSIGTISFPDPAAFVGTDPARPRASYQLRSAASPVPKCARDRGHPHRGLEWALVPGPLAKQIMSDESISLWTPVNKFNGTTQAKNVGALP